MRTDSQPASRALCRDCCQLVETLGPGCPICAGRRLVINPEIAMLAIAHVDCDAFYAAVEKRDRPEFEGQPLIVGHPGGRGVVVAACYVARRFGVHSAMPMFQALELCPQAHVITPAMGKYKQVSERIRAIFRAATPIVEPVSLDEAYLDFSEISALDAQTPAEALANIAHRVEGEIGITVSIGLSFNKFLAKLASDWQKPRGFRAIARADAASVLAPLSVSKINGVGAVTARRMESGGITTIGDLQALSEFELAARFGRFGRRLALYAKGEDDRRVMPERPTKSISAETTFSRNTDSGEELALVARQLSERVAAQLARKNLAGAGVAIKLKTSDFRILTRSRQLSHPTQQASVIYETAAALIGREIDGRSFRLLGVGLHTLTDAASADPVDLFGASAPPTLRSGSRS
jgi:DNA polymerase-4